MAFGQRDSLGLFPDDLLADQNRFAIVPSIYYLPETSWYFGAGAFYYFKTNREDTLTRPSTINGALGYTLNDQIVFWLPAEIFFKHNNYLLKTELGFYRWPYFFNGIGNETQNFPEETYTAVFPRFRTSFLKRFGKSIYAGPRYWIQYLDMLSYTAGGQIAQNKVPGGRGGFNSGIGVEVIFDNRNSVYGPTKGAYVSFSTLHNQKAFGSDFNYNTYILDARNYLNLKKNHILAAQLFTKFNFGNPPFNQMALLGGNSIMRGYREGFFRDKHMILSQLEYRSPFWYRLGFAVFAGAGVVAPEVSSFQFSNLKPSLGGGLRFQFDKVNRLNIRLDYAFGANGIRNGYVTVSEAF